MKTKVTVRGQVSIPSPIRKKFNIEPETQVSWQVEGNTIRMIPLPKDPVSAFRGLGLEKYSTEKLIRDRKDDRQKER
jgi:AbrB family looped-hinge helix DNA binding protein